MSTAPKFERALADPLIVRSVEVLKAGQASSGALIASPDYGVYRYAWLRDGAFCAHALDLAGEHAAAAAWHRWTAGAIESHRGVIENAVARVRCGETPPPEQMPPARYTLDGRLETDSGDVEPWPNFQLDGYGTWLWSLAVHLGTRPLPDDLRPAVALVAEYLATCGRLPCWNCWEEFDGGGHASTLAAVAAGLHAAGQLLGDDRRRADAVELRNELLARFVCAGRFTRGANDERADGSLLWLSVPFELLPSSHPLIAATVEAVRRDLAGPGGGVYRFRGDTYYGGGQWLLLTSWLAWHDALAGDLDAAEEGQAWVRRQALPNGDLPEQVHSDPQDASMVEPWIRRWGSVATPLLWSHAMYLIAEDARLR